MGDPACPITLTGPKKLVELFHWRRGKASPGVWVVVNGAGFKSPRVDEVDWSLFPVAEAQEEIMSHEARCSRYLHRHATAA